jgi:HAD superfamily hydrolase (TIGR01509 family)
VSFVEQVVSGDEGDAIEFVYFDLGNMLVSFDPMIACVNLADRFAISHNQARRALYESGLQDQFERGQLSAKQFASAIRDRLGKTAAQVPTADLLDAASDMFTPIDSMRSVLATVRQRGFRVGLLSNTCDSHWDWIQRQRYRVMDFAFDTIILSFEVQSMKPDPAIYEAAEQAAGLPAERILFLDDRGENVAAAIARGWNAVQCFGGLESLRALQQFRVLEGSQAREGPTAGGSH